MNHPKDELPPELQLQILDEVFTILIERGRKLRLMRQQRSASETKPAENTQPEANG